MRVEMTWALSDPRGPHCCPCLCLCGSCPGGRGGGRGAGGTGSGCAWQGCCQAWAGRCAWVLWEMLWLPALMETPSHLPWRAACWPARGRMERAWGPRGGPWC